MNNRDKHQPRKKKLMLTKEEELDLYVKIISEDIDAELCRHILALNAEIEKEKNNTENKNQYKVHSKLRIERDQ